MSIPSCWFHWDGFPHWPSFGPCPMVRVLPNVQSAWLHIYMSSYYMSTQCFLNIMVLWYGCQYSLKGRVLRQWNAWNILCLALCCIPALLQWTRGPPASECGNNWQYYVFPEIPIQPLSKYSAQELKLPVYFLSLTRIGARTMSQLWLYSHGLANSLTCSNYTL